MEGVRYLICLPAPASLCSCGRARLPLGAKTEHIKFMCSDQAFSASVVVARQINSSLRQVLARELVERNCSYRKILARDFICSSDKFCGRSRGLIFRNCRLFLISSSLVLRPVLRLLKIVFLGCLKRMWINL